MLSTMFLDLAAETLCRGFGVTVTLTLVEFENGETTQNVSPLGLRSRAVPILGENQEVRNSLNRCLKDSQMLFANSSRSFKLSTDGIK